MSHFSAGRRLVLAATSLLALLATAPAAYAGHVDLDLRSVGPEAGPTQPYNAFFQWSNHDGSSIIFATEEPLVEADDDSAVDIYRRAGSVTTRLTQGSATGAHAQLAHVSADGSRVVYSTTESLSLADTDAEKSDLYQWDANNGTILISDPEAGQPDTAHVYFEFASEDGSRIFFKTTDPVTSDDGDASQQDSYQWHQGTKTRITVGNTNDSALDHRQLDGITRDGTRAYFSSVRELDDADDDAASDVYERVGTTTTLISDRQPAAGPDTADHAGFRAVSDDGTRVLFSHREQVTTEDGDSEEDLFLRSGGTTTLVSAGTAAVFFLVADPTLERFLYVTPSDVSADDTDPADGGHDIYRATLGNTANPVLISRRSASGPDPIEGDIDFHGATEDLAQVFFSATSPMGGEAEDGEAEDLYRRSGSSTTHLTPGPAASNTPAARFDVRAISPDGSRVYLTAEDASLVAADTDDSDDVYRWSGGVLTLLSLGPAGGNGEFDADLDGISGDGRVAFFGTDEALLSSDDDGEGGDVYAARMGAHDPVTEPDPEPASPPAGGAPPAGITQAPPPPTPLPGVVRDTRPPVLTVSPVRGQRARRVRGAAVRVRVDEAAAVVATGTIRIRGRAKRLRLARARTTLAAGASKRVTVKLKGRALRTLLVALGGRSRATAKIKVVATDAAGNVTRRTLTVRLRR